MIFQDKLIVQHSSLLALTTIHVDPMADERSAQCFASSRYAVNRTTPLDVVAMSSAVHPAGSSHSGTFQPLNLDCRSVRLFPIFQFSRSSPYMLHLSG